jgi:hypothetical protein
MRFIGITGIPDPWLYNAIPTGAPEVGGQSPSSVFAFFVPLPGTLFRSEIPEHYSDYIFSRLFLYELVVKMALYPYSLKRILT